MKMTLLHTLLSLHVSFLVYLHRYVGSMPIGLDCLTQLFHLKDLACNVGGTTPAASTYVFSLTFTTPRIDGTSLVALLLVRPYLMSRVELRN